MNQYHQTRQHTLEICKHLRPEDSTAQPVPDVSPPKWHLAHTTWFFETFILLPFYKDYQVFHPDYGFLFNSYYETLGKRINREKRGSITRPGLSEVLAYREFVDLHMETLLASGIIDDSLQALLTLGLQHEQQHQELLYTDIKYILGHNPVFPVYDVHSVVENHTPNTIADAYVTVIEGIYPIGYEGNGFCFDNELGRHKVFLHEFQIKNLLVTNREYLQFMEDGGYEKFVLWLADGWEWVKQNEAHAPMYWHHDDAAWKRYTLKGLQAADLNAPVTHVNFYEADAFARWKGCRLPTEFEWEAASSVIKYGACWEWTNSAYLPYPYYKRAEGAVGEYNGKFMNGQMVLRGGSVASPPGHLRPTYRNFFPPDKQWQFTGIRLAYH